jgi:hypothetical protein
MCAAEASGCHSTTTCICSSGLRVGERYITDAAMGADCVRHAPMFFNRPDFDLATAAAGTFALVPHDGMRANLEQDYRAMSEMIFGEIPAFDGILESIVQLQQLLNG